MRRLLQATDGKVFTLTTMHHLIDDTRTRAKECLILSRTQRSRGWPKQPSRFLVEMGFAS